MRGYLLVATAVLPTAMTISGASAQSGAPSQPSVTNPAPQTNSASPAGNSANDLQNRGPVRRELPPLPRRASPSKATEAAPAAVASPAAAPAAPPAKWSPEEIAAAKAQCAVALYGVEAKFEPEEPIKEGACGSPHVVKLVSVGKSPEVVLNPPATVTCDMVAGLYKWLKTDVQPLARRELGGVIVKIETMSSYSCRNAYGRSRTNLSEHGRANALDIGGFTTAAGDTTKVLASWGPTLRDMRSLAGVGKTEPPAKAPETPSVSSPPATSSAPTVKSAPQTASGSATPSPTSVLPGVIIRSLPGLDHGSVVFGLAPPSRLGGPKPKDEHAGAPQPASGPKILRPEAKATTGPVADLDPKRTKFLREVHALACKHFGTVLGPEANRDHLNHFHLDMAPRKTGNYCH